MLRHGYNPDYMLEAIISSIPKNRKESLNCSENYRGIAMCSALCNVFDSIIIKRYYDQLMSNDLQFSFKVKHSTVTCTATLKEIASHYNAKGSQVFMCMLDATKAFDKVDFVKLFELLMRRDVPGVFLRPILDLYTRQRLKTAWNGAISLPFSVKMVSGRVVYTHPFFSMYILMNCCKDCKIMTLAAMSEQNLWGHLVMLMIWHYCLLLCGDCKRLLIFVMILPKNTQWNLIRRRLNVCVLEKMVNSFKVISIWTEKS